jgi:hypothetical protein
MNACCNYMRSHTEYLKYSQHFVANLNFILGWRHHVMIRKYAEALENRVASIFKALVCFEPVVN